MKNLIIIVVLMLVSFSAFSQRNPQIRVCNLNGAYFWSLDITQPRADNVGFCRYGESLIGSLTLIEYFNYNRLTDAMSAVLKSAQTHFNNCSQAGASAILAVDSDDVLRSVCMFEDYSFVLERTLREGLNSSFNAELKSAL